jgi:hypothetical protein
VKARRQIGARHVAWVRGAFRGGRLRLGQRVGQPANLGADGLTRGTGALTGGPPTHSGEPFQGPDFRGGGAGWNSAVFAYRQTRKSG